MRAKTIEQSIKRTLVSLWQANLMDGRRRAQELDTYTTRLAQSYRELSVAQALDAQ